MGTSRYLLDFLGACCFACLLMWAALPDPDSPVRITNAASNAGPTLTTQGMPNVLAGVPCVFEANRGQAKPEVQFLSRGKGCRELLTEKGFVWKFLEGSGGKRRAPTARLRFLNGGRTIRWQGEDELRARVNYFLGNDAGRWKTDIPVFARVRAADVFPGVDAEISGNAGELEYDLIVAPAADAAGIRMQIDGTDRLSIDSRGDLMVIVGGEQIRMRKPNVYQLSGTSRIPIDGRYLLDDDGIIEFRLGRHDSDRTVVIDPSISISYSSFLGGSGVDSVNGMAIDPAGNVYVGGTTTAADFPEAGATKNGSLRGGSDFFVAKINPKTTGTGSLIYLTYLGGSGDEEIGVVAVDGSQNVVLAGSTTSADFPLANPAQGKLQGSSDLVVSKLSPSGSSLAFSTYFGGSGAEATQKKAGIAVDGSGNVYVTSDTSSTNLPVTLGAFRPHFGGGTSDGFLAVFSPAGSLTYCTYFGIDATVGSAAVAVDTLGPPSAYVAGFTSQPGGTSFPATNGFQPTYQGGTFDAFVMKLAPKGLGSNDLSYATFLGGTGLDQAFAIAVDNGTLPNAYVAGTTQSVDYPVNGSIAPFQGSLAGASNAFLAMIAQDATSHAISLAYSTYLGAGLDSGSATFVVGPNQVYIAGKTTAAFFPTLNTQQAFSGQSDAFVAEFDPTRSGANSLLFSTLLGGSANAEANGVVADSNGHVLVAGGTDSADYPIAGHPQSGFQPTCSSCAQSPPVTDAFLTVLSESSAPAPIVSFSSPKLNFGSQSVGAQNVPPQAEEITNSGNTNLAISSLQISGPNASDFSLQFTNACTSGSFPSGGSCSFEVGFTPSKVGSETASVDVTDNASGSPQSVILAGTGTGPLAVLSATSLNFGSQPENTTSNAQVLTLTNGGNVPLTITGLNLSGANTPDFALLGGNTCTSQGSIPSGSSCIISAVFSPQGIGNYNAQINITDNSGNISASIQVVPISGTGTAPAAVADITPLALNFGSEVLNKSSGPQGVTIKNAGSLPLQITSIAITGANGAEFGVVAAATTCPSSDHSLAMGATCTVAANFTPVSKGAKVAALSLTDNALSSPQQVSLSGIGVAPSVTLSATSLGFTNQTVGTASGPQSVTLSNVGNGTLTIANLSIVGADGGDFVQINNCPPGLSAGASCVISVSFAPTAAGSRTAAVTIQDDAAGSPQAIALTGTGLSAAVTLFPSSITFPGQLVSTASPAGAVTVGNGGDGVLALGRISFGGANAADFSETDNCGANVSNGATCTVNVVFKPTAAGPRTGIMNVNDNVPGSPQTVALTGAATDFSLSVASGGSASATVTPGQTVNYELLLTPIGGFTGSVTIGCAGVPAAAACTPSASPISVDGAAPIPFTLGVKTASAGFEPPFVKRRAQPRGPSGRIVVELVLFVLVSLALIAFRLKRPARFAFGTAGLSLALLLVACAGGPKAQGLMAATPSGMYTLTVMGTQQGTSRTLKLTLTVQ
jgi:hypothetical protein